MGNEFIDQIARLSDNTRTPLNRVESSQFSILIMNSMIVAKLLSKLNKYYIQYILSIDSKIDQNDEEENEETRVQGFPKIIRHAAC